jgi:hypothetical protein
MTLERRSSTMVERRPGADQSKPQLSGREPVLRGTTMKRFIVGLMSVLAVGALSVAPAFGAASFNSSRSNVYRLHDVKNIESKLQPDALEFNNNGPVEFATKAGTLTCTEMELGATVLKNNVKEVATLAVPFGIAEGDSCTVPTYFDTLGNGAVGAENKVASIAVAGAGPTFTATIRNLKLSLNVSKGTYCTANLNGIHGEVNNVIEGFVEEAPPNLNVQFTKAAIAVTGTGCTETAAEFTANFYLETMSTITDTAFVTP